MEAESGGARLRPRALEGEEVGEGEGGNEKGEPGALRHQTSPRSRLTSSDFGIRPENTTFPSKAMAGVLTTPRSAIRSSDSTLSRRQPSLASSPTWRPTRKVS